MNSIFFRTLGKKAILVMALVAGLIIGVKSIATHSLKTKAGEITSITVTPSNTSTNTNADYTFSFKPASDLSSGGYIYLVFKGNDWGYFDTYNSTVDSIKIDGTSTTKIEKSWFSGNWLSFYVNSDVVIAGKTVEIKVKDIRNPYYAGGYQVLVYTYRWGNIDGDYQKNQYLSNTFTIGTLKLHGTVTFNGSGLSGAYINVYDSSYQHYGYASTNSSGYYELGDSLPAGNYTLNVSPPWNQTSAKNYRSTVALDDTNQLLDVTLQAKTKTISGTVKDDSNNAIANAYIYGYQSGSWDYAYANTDSSGNYSMLTGGGEWQINLSRSWDADWVYQGGTQVIKFANDQTSESQTLNFDVIVPKITLSGSVVTVSSSGVETGAYNAGVSVWDSKYVVGFWRNTDTSGNFSGKITAGKYKVWPWYSDQTYSMDGVYIYNTSTAAWEKSSGASFTAGENDTSISVKIKYIQKTDHITGKVADENGTGIAGVSVYGWKNSSSNYDWANTTTASDGTYDLLVSPGDWQISAWPQWNSNYTYLGKPLAVNVVSGTTAANQNFSFMTLNATINGTVVDTDGTILDTLSTWAYLDTSGLGEGLWYANIGASVANGKFTMKVPAGSHKVKVGWGGSDYSPGDPTDVTIASGETKEINVVMLKNDATITGYIKDTDGNAITGKYCWINASNNRQAWANASVDTTTGQYTMKVAAGSWYMSYWVDYNSGYASQMMDDNKVTIASQETVIKDITLRKIDATINGKVTKSDGTAMEYIPVSVNTRSSQKDVSSRDGYYMFANSGWTDSDGNYSVRIPNGTYYVKATIPYWQQTSLKLIAPQEVKTTVEKDQTATINLSFRVADATIIGQVTYNGGGINAYVWAWSENAGASQATADSNGNFTLDVTKNDIWHIGATRDAGTDVYMSDEYLVDIGSSSSLTQNIVLKKKDWSLPDAVSSTFDPTKQKTIKLSDGTVINIPANALVTDTSNPPTSVTLTATPKAQLPVQKGDKPLWYGYDFTVSDNTGTQISTFSSDITISFPYTDEQLTALGITADDLTTKYFNETTGAWEEIGNSVIVDQDNHLITVSTDHFTQFAIMTSVSDNTPPSAPTNITATAGNAKATLGWTNPTDADLTGIKIYRSTTSGQLGDLLTTIANKTTVTYENTGLTNGTTYYYTVRSYDTTGNISTNTTQVSAAPSAPSSALPATGGPY